MKNTAQTSFTEEIFVDNFAGGGGASTGIETGLGVTIAAAINHDPAAILMHKTNHPGTSTQDRYVAAGRSLAPGFPQTASIFQRPKAPRSSIRKSGGSLGLHCAGRRLFDRG